MNLSQSYHEAGRFREINVGLVRDALDQGGFKPKRDANGFRANCPAHSGADGHTMTVHPKDGGGVLIHCHSQGCTHQQVLEALGLWEDRAPLDVSPGTREPISFACEEEGGSTIYQYQDASGTGLYQNVRKPGKKFQQRRVSEGGEKTWGLGGIKQIPYGLPELVNLRYAHAVVHVTEGEKDTIRLRQEGFLAVSISDGAVHDGNLEYFRDRHVVIHEDNDDPGRKKSAARVEWLQGTVASIRVMGYSDLHKGGDVSDWWDLEGTPVLFHKRLAQLKQVQVKADEPDWSAPAPLDPGYGPEFDSNLLPEVLRDFVQYQAAAYQVPVDMAVTIALGTISAAIGGWYEISMEPRTWREPVHGMFIAVLEPGARKSAIVSRFTRALIDWQASQQEDDRMRLAEWESTERKLKREQERLEGPPKRGEVADDETRDLQRRAAVRELFDHQKTKPVITVIVTDDATPQAITNLLIEQRGRAAVVSAESAYLENIAGRYSDSPDLNTFLHGHAGEALHEHRRDGRSAYIKSASLTLCMAVQPHVIERMGGVSGFQERGGASRLLMTIPRDNAGTRLTGRNVPTVPNDVEEWWDRELKRLLRTRHDSTSKTKIPMTADARLAVERFEALVESRYPFLSNDRVMRSWISKQVGAAMRIAGLLHVISGDPTQPMEATTMQRGIEISEWYREHAAIAFKMMDGSSDSVARTVWTVLAEMGEMTVSRSDLHLKLRGRSDFKKASDLDSPLEVLEGLGYVRIRKIDTGKRGRPSVLIEVNPLALNGPGITSQRHDARSETKALGLEEIRLVGEAI